MEKDRVAETERDTETQRQRQRHRDTKRLRQNGGRRRHRTGMNG